MAMDSKNVPARQKRMSARRAYELDTRLADMNAALDQIACDTQKTAAALIINTSPPLGWPGGEENNWSPAEVATAQRILDQHSAWVGETSKEIGQEARSAAVRAFFLNHKLLHHFAVSAAKTARSRQAKNAVAKRQHAGGGRKSRLKWRADATALMKKHPNWDSETLMNRLEASGVIDIRGDTVLVDKDGAAEKQSIEITKFKQYVSQIVSKQRHLIK